MANIRCCCSRRDQRIAISGFTFRSVMAGFSRKRPSTGCTRPSRSRVLTDETCFSRAARCWADRARSTACFMSAVSMKTTIAGASTAIWAGASMTCCLISRRPRTRRAAATIFTRSAVPCRSRTGGMLIRYRRRSSMRRRKSASPEILISTAPRRKAPAFSRPRPKAGDGRAQRSLIFVRPRPGPTCMSRRRRSPSGSCSRDVALLAWRIAAPAFRARRGRARKF